MKYLVLLFLIAFMSCKTRKNKIEAAYGPAYNQERALLGMPLVSPDMELINDQGVYKYIYKNKNESLPHHAWKILLVNSLNELYVEEDNFFNPGKNEWLIAQHNYKNHLTSYKYLDPQNSSKAIDGRVFDSVLTSWKIELYKEPVIIGNK